MSGFIVEGAWPISGRLFFRTLGRVKHNTRGHVISTGRFFREFKFYIMELSELIELLPEKIFITGNFSEPNQMCIDYNGCGDTLNLKVSQAVWNHSPDGFAWGYAGSGPRQLALAILLEFLPYRLASKYSNDFKFKAIGALPSGDLYEHEIAFRETMRQIMVKGTATV